MRLAVAALFTGIPRFLAAADIVREIGPKAARLAVSALPRELPFRVELAIRAVERVLNLGLGLGR